VSCRPREWPGLDSSDIAAEAERNRRSWQALNGAPNISYLTPAQLASGAELADLAYSFAVVQPAH
jgi:hypothetical protein